MTLFILSYFGGVLTILSPCVLPVLPFVFARAGRPFVSSILPMLLGMALTFALVATLAAVGGGWAVQANEFGRYAAMALLALFGLSLALPELADRVTRPLVSLGSRLSQTADAASAAHSVPSSLLLGVATGLLWSPCAGPILGLVLTGAALSGASARTSLLLLTFALGAATSLGAALLIGGQVFSALKRSLGLSEWIRRGLGIAILLGVAVTALGLDSGLLTRLSLAQTASVEDRLLNRFHTDKVSSTDGTSAPGAQITAQPSGQESAATLPIEGVMPPLTGAVAWLNSPPLSTEGLRGKVVLIDFWTYSCINCLRALPYVRAWADKYRDAGLVVIGVHTPEFAFEKNIDNVRREIGDLKITYPVAVDNNYAIWRAFDNRFWPAHDFIDTQGQIRYHHFGEGEYQKSEMVIRQLLTEAGKAAVAVPFVEADAKGIGQAPDDISAKSPETYIGFSRAERFVSAGGELHDTPHQYQSPTQLNLNDWGLVGVWQVEAEDAVLRSAPGHTFFRFHARDLHLVLGPSASGKPVRFRVLLDGKAPASDRGLDIDEDGHGSVTEQRLYQLIRQKGKIMDRTFDIEFLDPGVQAFAFTFG
jgi:cytochrome c biogenesis protein CcdA/thiol-disulfide isomerase/thioredoxin